MLQRDRVDDRIPLDVGYEKVKERKSRCGRDEAVEEMSSLMVGD